MPTLRELRMRALLSQEELADAAGVGRRTIINIETGQRVPRLRTMRQIAKALGVQWNEIVEFVEAMETMEEMAADRRPREG